MQERAFLGTCTIGDAPASATNIAAFFISHEPGPARQAIGVSPKLSADHAYDVPGSTECTYSITLGGLDGATTDLLNSKFLAGTKQRVTFRPNTGAKGTENPEEIMEGFILEPPTNPRNLTEEATFTINFGRLTYYSWDNGGTPRTMGTVAV